MALAPSNRKPESPSRGKIHFVTRLVVILFAFLSLTLIAVKLFVKKGVQLSNDQSRNTKRSLAKEMAPSKPRKAETLEVVQNNETPRWTNLHGKVVTDYRFAVPPGSYRDESGVLRRPGGMRILEREPAHVINISKSKTERLFSNGAENQILDLLMFDPNKTHLAAGIYGPGFVNSFKKSLEQNIEIFPDDPVDVRDKKLAVIEAKKELKTAMDNGEDICEIMRESSRQMIQLANYRKDLESEVINVLKQDVQDNDNVSDDDIATYIAAANKLLEDRGAEPLKTPKLIMIGERLREKKYE